MINNYLCLSKPETYWESYPVKWYQINKKIQLAHVGLDHIISTKTKELVHDRSDTSINIKMFSPINVMIGRDGDAKSSKVKQDLDGVQIETTDSWTELTTIAQLDEVLDILTRLWLIMWPFAYGPANLKEVLGKYKNFASSFENISTRKRVL